MYIHMCCVVGINDIVYYRLWFFVLRKQHCEVEKKRRDKMNYYMCELATMIPACSEVPRKLDKLSILKMAVEHMKRLRGDHKSNKAHRCYTGTLHK